MDSLLISWRNSQIIMQEKKTKTGDSPHTWWWLGPWKRCSTTGSTVSLTAARQTPGAPAGKQLCEHLFLFFSFHFCLFTLEHTTQALARQLRAGAHTVSSSSSCREKVERRDMLDSEWSDRTEMAESDLRGVPMGGWWGAGRKRSLCMQRSSIWN